MVRSQPGPRKGCGKMSKKESEDMENSLLICDNDKLNAVFNKGGKVTTVDDGQPCGWEQPL